MSPNPSEQFLEFAKNLGSDSIEVLSAVAANQSLRATVSGLRALFIFVGIVFAVLIVIIARKAHFVAGLKKKYYEMYLPAKSSPKTAPTYSWKAIGSLVESASPASEYREAVLAADEILYSALRERDLPGETSEEKLYHVTPAEIRNLGRLIRAHRVAAILRETPEAYLSQGETRTLIDIYATALQELGVQV